MMIMGNKNNPYDSKYALDHKRKILKITGNFRRFLNYTLLPIMIKF